MPVLNDSDVKAQLEDAIWVSHQLFARNKVSGSSANLSFRHGDKLVISASGSTLGQMSVDDFSVIDFSGKLLEGRKPSKEWPLHVAFYQRTKDCGAVLHTHSFYSVLWSCMDHKNPVDIVPKYTPYLEMKLGKIGLIPYAPPGSQELFAYAKQNIELADGFLLSHHGPIVPGKNILDAFNILEELEESCRIAWEFKDHPEITRIS